MPERTAGETRIRKPLGRAFDEGPRGEAGERPAWRGKVTITTENMHETLRPV